MKTLTNNELSSINGGFSKLFWAGLGIGFVFLASVIYGYIKPNKC